ncbi:MAG: ABC transporter ATP-binding protein [Acutalibacteraceae bacterium]|nr:ABC transporter ATP-binding protein [Acutalibacteraceae bacterium]
MSFITLTDVTKTYKMGEVTIPAANKISFSVDEGEFVIIVGPSGSGKTTLLNMLGGMDPCDSGDILIGDKNIARFTNKELTKYRKNDIGFVFQFYNLIPNLTARENVEISCGMGKNKTDADDILEKVGLKDRQDNFPSQLSGGEQQRVSIARAMAKKPKLLLCDEPTGALDYATGKVILSLLQKTCKEEKTTVIVVTHNSALTPMADRVIKLKNGAVDRIIKNAEPFSVDDIEW